MRIFFCILVFLNYLLSLLCYLLTDQERCPDRAGLQAEFAF